MKYFYKSKHDDFAIKAKYSFSDMGRNFSTMGRHDINLENVYDIDTFIKEISEILADDNILLSFRINCNKLAIDIQSKVTNITRYLLYNASPKILNELILSFAVDLLFKNIFMFFNDFLKISDEAKLKIELR